MAPLEELPEDLLATASIRKEVGGNELGWRIADFPSVLRKARAHGLACCGGQFQFRFEDGTCELYWHSADASRRPDEPWDRYSERSIREVAEQFSKLCRTIDFEKEIEDWAFIRAKRDAGLDPMQFLWFVAYFDSEASAAALREWMHENFPHFPYVNPPGERTGDGRALRFASPPQPPDTDLDGESSVKD